ncbi:ABC transporter ATP-binding protein [Microbacterium sp. 3J1]|uniref:ABC transporter ATP-binding protein n=1 Tax=Microbacterium sp. 3J1 TaxID=861269 RepID=UPI000AD74392|nr:ABC transporter ATP-binding protein [Microbacterium sp. 3J1]
MGDASRDVVRADGITKIYSDPDGRPLPVLKDVSLTVGRGEFVAIVGPSGSGKSTLLYALSGLEPVDGGSVEVAGKRVDTLSRAALAKLRRDEVGVIFQTYNLIGSLTARENIALPAILAHRALSASAVDEALADVGLSDRGDHRPRELSGGQQQRVAIARVLAAKPQVVFADEPTGALDELASAKVLELLHSAATADRSVVLVTHDLEAAATADRVLVLRDGEIHRQLANPSARAVLDAVTEAGQLS